MEDGNGGSFELPAMESEENHVRKTPENNGIRNVNGDSVKVKEEIIDRRSEEDDEEYIEVDEVNVKTEPLTNSQDCTDSKNGKVYILYSSSLKLGITDVSISSSVHSKPLSCNHKLSEELSF